LNTIYCQLQRTHNRYDMDVEMCEQFETNQCPSIFGLIYALIYIKYRVGRIHASDKVILNIINKSNQTQINTI